MQTLKNNIYFKPRTDLPLAGSVWVTLYFLIVKFLDQDSRFLKKAILVFFRGGVFGKRYVHKPGTLHLFYSSFRFDMLMHYNL